MTLPLHQHTSQNARQPEHFPLNFGRISKRSPSSHPFYNLFKYFEATPLRRKRSYASIFFKPSTKSSLCWNFPARWLLKACSSALEEFLYSCHENFAFVKIFERSNFLFFKKIRRNIQGSLKGEPLNKSMKTEAKNSRTYG